MYQTICVLDFRWLLGIWAITAVTLVAWSWKFQGQRAAASQAVLLAAIGAVIAFALPNMVGSEGLPIRGYGVMLFVAMAAGVALTMWRARRMGLDPEIILALGVPCLFFGILGARVFYIVEYWDKFQHRTLGETLLAMVNLTQGGLVVYGSLLAGAATVFWYIHRHHLPGLAFTDLLAPGIVLGVGLGRIGCFLNGCCYGGLSDLPWAVQFPQGSPAFVDQMQSGDLFIHGLIFAGGPSDPPVIKTVQLDSPAARAGLQAGGRVVEVNQARVDTVEAAQFELLRLSGDGTPIAIRVAENPRPVAWKITPPPEKSRFVHPAQLYSLIDALLLCFLLLAYEPYKRRDGELTALLLTVHPISRFLLEIIRVDESSVFNTGMSISQNISIAIFACGLALWAYLWLSRQPRETVWPADAVLAS